MRSHGWLTKTLVLALVWLLVTTLMAVVPSNQANASDDATVVTSAASVESRATEPDLNPLTSTSRSFGERSTSGSHLRASAVTFNAFSSRCNHLTCSEPSEPKPTPCDPAAGAAASAAAARAEVLRKIQEPSWIVYPADSRQIVRLETFLYIAGGYTTVSATGPTICRQSVTVTASPQQSLWRFTENGTGKKTSVTCNGPGTEWSAGRTSTSCGKWYFHSSAVTGTVNLKVGVKYEISWSSAYTSGDQVFIKWSKNEGTLTVREVMTWITDSSGASPPGSPIASALHTSPTSTPLPTATAIPTPSPLSISGRVPCRVGSVIVAWVLPGVTCDDVEYARQLATTAVSACAQAVKDNAQALAQEFQSLVGDPVQHIKNKIADVQQLIDLAKTDFTAFLALIAKTTLQLPEDPASIRDWTPAQQVSWAAGLFCTLVVDYLTGRIATNLIPTARPNGNNNNQPNITCRHSSFPGDTLVAMADGSHRRIDAIEPGDRVLSHNFDTSVWEPKQVLDQWSHPDRGPPATVTLADGSRVTGTDDHLFWVGNTGSWTELQWLQPGDQLLTPAGAVSVQSAVTGPGHDWLVWELTVADNHNFTVAAGRHDLLVHNRSCNEGPFDNVGQLAPGGGRIGDPPTMNGGSPPRIVRSDGTTQKPRRPSTSNASFDHTQTRTDPVTGETTYVRKDGSTVTYDANGFPKFTSALDVYLNPSELGSGSNTRDFGSSNDKVLQGLIDDPTLLDGFPPAVRDFYAQPNPPNLPPPGYTWHHHQDTGRMQLVQRGIHDGFPHTGGASIWGKQPPPG